jgi:hypothetical protein
MNFWINIQKLIKRLLNTWFKKRKFSVTKGVAHLVFCAVFIALDAYLVQYDEGYRYNIYNYFIYYLITVIALFIYVWCLLPMSLRDYLKNPIKNIGRTVLATLSLFFIYIGLVLLISFIWGDMEVSLNSWEEGWTLIVYNIRPLLSKLFFISSCGLMLYAFNQLFNSEMLRMATLNLFKTTKRENVLLVDNQLRLLNQAQYLKQQWLKSRLDPHTLINTLYGVDTLIMEDPENAQEVLLHIGELMQFYMDESHRERIPLSAEIAQCKRLIDLNAIRYPNQFAFIWKEPDDIKGLHILPMSLFLLIENTFKHGLKDNALDPTLVVIDFDGTNLTYFIRNRIGVKQTGKRKPLGLQNLKEQLAYHYKDKHHFTTVVRGNFFEVRLVFQLN